MKILILTRIYSALVDSIASKDWHPEGMPAYYKLLEALNRSRDDVDAVCLGKVAHNGIARYEKFRFNNLNIDFHVVPYRKIPLVEFHLNNIINDISQFFYCFKLGTKKNYDLIYVDRENIIYGAIFSSFFKKKVVIRLLGIAFLIRRMEGIKRWLKAPFRYLSYKAPFSYVICSKDGNGERYFLNNFVNKKVLREILLNGVDNPPAELDNAYVRKKYNLKESYPVILFAGKMERQKGCSEFVEALIELNLTNNKFYAVMVGRGPMLIGLKEKVVKNGLSDRVIFADAVGHDEIYQYYVPSDIYTSVNKLGNLSNTVLEAINAGKYVVILSPSEKEHIDKDTYEVIPADYAIRVDRNNIAHDLTKKLGMLINDNGMIKLLSEKSTELSRKIFKSWEKRIDYEINILNTLTFKCK